MGVSIDSGGGNVDLNLALQGGQAFLDRLQQLKDAKDGADEARANLGCAQNVIALRDAASRALSEAQEQATNIQDAALQKAATAQKAATEWLSQTKDAAAADRLAADSMRKEAEKMHADAKAALEEATRKHQEADAKLSDVNAKQAAFAAAAAVLNKAVG
jgi:hypothetical protein